MACVATVVPLQLLAYHTACVRGTDVDKPRNLAKSVPRCKFAFPLTSFKGLRDTTSVLDFYEDPGAILVSPQINLH